MARRRKKIKQPESEVDLTSMIDVCFLLIAFFIMVVEVTKAEIVEIFLPHASYAKQDDNPPNDRLIINIDREGKIFMRSEEFGKPNDKANREKILTSLIGYSSAVGFDEKQDHKPSKLTVLVRSDAHVEYKYVQCVMVLLTNPKVKVEKVHYGAKDNSDS